MFQQGEAALRAHDRDKALQCFRQAAAYVNEMDPSTAQRLLDHLQLLSAPPVRAGQGPMGQPVVDEEVARQQALARQLATELERQESAARSILERDSKGALALLEQERKRIEAAGLAPQYRDILLRNCDRSLAEVQDFIAKNRSPARIGRQEQSHPAGDPAREAGEDSTGSRSSRAGE